MHRDHIVNESTAEMRIKVIGILALVLYLGIQVRGEHLGGPLIIFIFIGLFDDSILVVMLRALILLAVFVLLWTILEPRIKRDKFIVPIGLTILIIPLIEHTYERGHYHLTHLTAFTITSGLFVILAGYWIVATLRRRT
jgi:hypothetical protein